MTQQQSERRRQAGVFILVSSLCAAFLAGCVEGTGGDGMTSVAPSASATAVPSTLLKEMFVDLRTGETAPLPAGIAGGYSYRVSPDSSRIAFESCCGEFFVANIDGSGAHRVTPDRLDAQGASWSPDGSMLVFQGRKGPGAIGNLFIVDVRAGTLRRITDFQPRQSGWWFLWPSFSADGRSVLFHLPRRHWGPTLWDLWSVPVSGGRPVIIRRNAGMGQYSPNGKTIAYLPSLDPRTATGDSLWLMDRTGETRKVVEDRDIWWPRWSPDGTRIAYAAESYEIHVIDVATGRIRTVVDGGVAEWFDDHTLIVGPGGDHS
jgi:Tol biopolymer transport system component